ncbi:MAG: energy-coupling factor ABC transporter permease [Actinobacteria bacterium]|nr:energy-coupling factor ABC transporter permease [Actinomycetota bacterium]
MSHIHLPDGVIPVFWWIVGYVLTAAMLGLAISRTKSTEARRKVPLLGIIAAIMLIGQSIPLGFIPFHLGLAVLAGIVLGPWLGFMAAFISNMFLALIGHGGITVVGLNTMVVGSEVIIGYLLYGMVRRAIARPVLPVVLATTLTLIITITFMVGVVAIAQVNPALILMGEEEGAIRESVVDSPAAISLRRFITLIVPIAAIGIAIEALATGLIVKFIMGVRPDIVGAPARERGGR